MHLHAYIQSSQQLDPDLVRAGDLLETAERLRDLGEWPSAQRVRTYATCRL